MQRIFGILTGALVTTQVQHIFSAHAFGYTNTDPLHRISAVLFGVMVLGLLTVLFQRLFQPAFLHGFLVATGLFLSVDIILFHWIFRLHRITSGPEANVLEPLFVVFGLLVGAFGFHREWRTTTITHPPVGKSQLPR